MNFIDYHQDSKESKKDAMKVFWKIPDNGIELHLKARI